MPDTRQHRGAHPEDAALFGAQARPALHAAATELNWLLDHGYAMRSALALVGDRHGLAQRQRTAIARSTCAAADRDRRQAHQLPIAAVTGSEVWIDGYNVLITVEAALAGAVILFGRDRCYRDLASQHGTYRRVTETTPAIELIGTVLAGWGATRCQWLLDRPVSNSGRLRQILLAAAAARGWPWDVQLEFSPDAVLARTDAIVATSDSAVLDRCHRWVNAAREVVTERVPTAFIVDLQ